MNSSKWLYEMKVIAWTLVKLEKYFFKTDYIKNKLINYGSNVFSVNDGASCIKEIIETGFPAMVCRIGATELMVMNEYEKVCYNLQKDIPEKSVEQLVNWSGFFPKDIKYIEQFCELMKKSLNNANLIGVWGNPMEDYFVVKYAQQSKLCTLRSLEPWYGKFPWTKALEGKKVVVIHPFAKSIYEQYNNKRTILFENKNLLPIFNLRVVKAVQSLGENVDSRFLTWFDALDEMYKEVMDKDFDVAIIGCGAYGLPLAAKIKEAGKIAIHLGGATQLLFGIKGSRWDSHPIIKKLYNESWVRPSKEETPNNANEVENACYW